MPRWSRIVFVTLALGSAVAGTGCLSEARVLNIDGRNYESHDERVFVTTLPLPLPSDYEYVGRIDISGDMTDSESAVLQRMANIARELGANAVVEVKTWQTRAFGGQQLVHATGKGVRTDTHSLAPLTGEWR